MRSCKPLLLAVLAAASCQAMACYTVYDAGQRVVYRSAEPPVDMSRPLHETLPQRFPGGQLVFDQELACAAVTGPNRVALAAASARASAAAPLITDVATAEAAGVSYRVLSGDIVVVPPRDAAVALAASRERINVVPSATLASARHRAPGTAVAALPSSPATVAASARSSSPSMVASVRSGPPPTTVGGRSESASRDTVLVPSRQRTPTNVPASDGLTVSALTR